MRKHALIVGPRRVGKSTLIRKVIETLNCSVAGFETKKESKMEDETLGSPIYIHTIGAPWHYSEENLLGYCKNQKTQRISDAFNRYADKLLQPVPEGTIFCFDEIGFMESKEKAFCDAVLERLDGDIPILAAVKDKTKTVQPPKPAKISAAANNNAITLTWAQRKDISGVTIYRSTSKSGNYEVMFVPVTLKKAVKKLLHRN